MLGAEPIVYNKSFILIIVHMYHLREGKKNNLKPHGNLNLKCHSVKPTRDLKVSLLVIEILTNKRIALLYNIIG